MMFELYGRYDDDDELASATNSKVRDAALAAAASVDEAFHTYAAALLGFIARHG